MTSFVAGQTALILPVPHAESVVSDWRERFDPSALAGIPAHVTVVFPFVPLDHLEVGDMTTLRAIVAEQPRFTARFAQCGRFPGVLYLAPDDDVPFRALTAAVVRRWPQAQPYGGRYGTDVTPHLTVTNGAGEADSLRAETAVSALLPFSADVEAVWMLAFDGVRWRRQAVFGLGA